MNEEIEYAEMLEIPVSTVNVIKKKNRRKKKTAQPNPEPVAQPAPVPAQNQTQPQPSTEANPQPPLKDSVIAEVNERLNEQAQPAVTADAELFAESANSEGRLHFDPDPAPERIDTVRLYSTDDLQGYDLQEQTFVFGENGQNEGGRDGTNAKTDDTPKGVRIALGIEFAAACVLCGAIFLTNVFMPNSAVNTFFRALGTPNETVTDARTYAAFTLTPVVSELSDAELTLSAEGVLSFQDECCVYPAADGKVCELSKAEDGTYTLKIQHSDSFTGVIHGLDTVYYAVGDSVKANVPVGFTGGELPVQVTMYSSGELLNCFELTEENCLAWVDANK